MTASPMTRSGGAKAAATGGRDIGLSEALHDAAMNHADIIRLLRLPTPLAVELGRMLQRLLRDHLGHDTARLIRSLEDNGIPASFSEAYLALSRADAAGKLSDWPYPTAVAHARRNRKGARA